MNIIDEIVRKRRKAVARSGPAMGLNLPPRRNMPVVPFGKNQQDRDFFIICEIKRASPSRGLFASGRDAVSQAQDYVERGIHTVSVLTESAYFHGSLEDLIRVKERFPQLCVLRKDFILNEEDIDVSYRAGADAVLLIACMHDTKTLGRLYNRAKGLGLEVLFETHDRDDIQKASSVKPDVTGINSRDLATFRTDPAVPLGLKKYISWDTETVFESGIVSAEDGAVALSGGFSGMLIGEAAMRDADLIHRIGKLVRNDIGDFWYRLFSSKAAERPLVKICGITREEDAVLATELGAHILGFIFAPSPRIADVELPRKLAKLPVFKVAVVVHKKGVNRIDSRIQNLLSEGFIDAIQLHGDEGAEVCYNMAFPYYKALRIGSEDDVAGIGDYHCPRVLVDAFAPGKPGGTGQRIPTELVESIGRQHPLWLAGGIGPDNIADIVAACRPELVDASSRLESEPGVKHADSMRAFFKEIEAPYSA
jgi:indole-3-glycerol phosphate synthase/phosphoribosylanthranilate isomerase